MKDFSGKVLFLDRSDINTDEIIPAKYLTEITKDTKTRIVHMSTDCVFAGNDGPYYEDTLPNGATFYDRSKAMGEINTSKDLTFRNSIVGPDVKTSGIGLFNWFMKQEGEVDGYTGAIWTGVTTYTLAKAMEQALKENLTGLYNLVNNESINKYNLLCLFNTYFRAGEVKIKPNDKPNDRYFLNKSVCFNDIFIER